MSDLIKALQILLQYGDPWNPTHCMHDELRICGVDPRHVSEEDLIELEELGFSVDEAGPNFYSFRFGSC